MKPENKPSYTRLTYTERLIIEKLYNSGCTMRSIADQLSRAVSGICREIHRGLYDHLDGSTWTTEKRYSATIAQQDAEYQASAKGQEIKLGKHYDYAKTVAERIKNGESPDSIVGDLRNRGEWTVSTSTLYRYIDSGYIPGITNKDLQAKSDRKRKYNHVKPASRPPKGESIEKRPEQINDRSVPGHWEMDTVIGKASGKGEAVLVLTERFTRFEIIRKLHDKTSFAVVRALKDIITSYPDGTFQTITVDNGSENADYQTMKTMVDEVYYCHPYCSSERGSNENQNILIRRFFPKGQSMAHRTQADADKAAYFINHMHRKILNYHTSQELFDVWQEALIFTPDPERVE